MAWNHRVMRHKSKVESIPDYLGIHEVYYYKGKILAWSEQEASVGGNSIEEIRQVLKWMEECLEHPILDFDMKPEIDLDLTEVKES